MRTVQDVTFGVTAQPVTLDAMEGRPTSVTSATVYRWSDSDASTAESALGTPTVETTPNTTTNAAAGASQANPTTIPLTATTGIATGRTYLLTGSLSQREIVEVRAITSATSVNVKHPLINDYATAATFVSTRMTATVDATWVADATNIDASSGPNPMFRVRWVYVVAGVTYVTDSYFNLTRYAGKHGVTPLDVESIDPGWLDRLPTDHRLDQGRRLIDEAYRAVKLDLAEIDLDDSTIAESEIIDELTRYMAAGDAAKYQTRRDSLTRIVNRVPVRAVTGAAARQLSVGLSRR